MSPRAQALDGIRRILVRCPNHAGDVVMATPGLLALRRAHPEATIVAQLPAPLVPLLEGAGLVDELWSLTARDSARAGFAGLSASASATAMPAIGRAAAMRRDARRIAEGRFELGIAIPESISSALLMRLGRVEHIVGFARDPLRGALLHEIVPADPAWGPRRLVSRERFVLRLMEAVGAGAEAGPPRLVLATTEAEAERLDRVLRPLGLPVEGLAERQPIVLAPGAGYGDAKCWPAESFAALADRLAGTGNPIVLIGSPGEGARLAAVARAMRSRPVVLDGLLDLGALKVLLRRARLLVSNDAGARHVAAAFGVPSVVFFGPTAVAKTPDNLERVAVLETEHACRPCYLRDCPIDHRCLRDISVERAFTAAERIVAECGA
ncbi:MAG: glycosyltransferase family 9 protein [Thermoleophilia bacterium]|nr:glycosyltransferase family 9 protein [Thermoleophilia bacterium]